MDSNNNIHEQQDKPQKNEEVSNEDSLLEFSEPIIKFSEQWSKAMEVIGQSVTKAILSVEERMQEALKNVTELAPILHEHWLETTEDIDYFKEAIVALGYPPHEDLDISKIREISQFLRESENSEKIEVKEQIDTIMTSYYDPEMINHICNKWEECDHIRLSLPILRNINMAHNLQLFNLSVPAAVSLFEGIVMDVFEIKGKTSNVMLGELLKILLSDNSSYSFDKELYKFYEDNVKVSFSLGKLVGSDISRHAILHGYDKKYGQEKVSLKAILFLDQLIMASKSLSPEKKLQGQRVITSIRKDYITQEELEEKGYMELGHAGGRSYLGNFNPKTKTLVYHKQTIENKFTKFERKITSDEVVLLSSIMNRFVEPPSIDATQS